MNALDSAERAVVEAARTWVALVVDAAAQVGDADVIPQARALIDAVAQLDETTPAATADREWGVRWIDDGEMEAFDTERAARRAARINNGDPAEIVFRDVTVGAWVVVEEVNR